MPLWETGADATSEQEPWRAGAGENRVVPPITRPGYSPSRKVHHFAAPKPGAGQGAPMKMSRSSGQHSAGFHGCRSRAWPTASAQHEPGLRNSPRPRRKVPGGGGWGVSGGMQWWQLPPAACCSTEELQGAGITCGCTGATWPQRSSPAQGAQSVSCGSGEVSRWPFPRPGFLGRPLPGMGKAHRYSDFLKMLNEIRAAEPQPKGLVDTAAQEAQRELKPASSGDPGLCGACMGQ